MNSACIIVVTWNNADDSIKCIKSLLRQDISNFVILSIDNGSNDDSAERLRSFVDSSEPGRVEYLQTGHNGGTSGGFNAGIRWAMEHKYQYVGSLNADAVADTAWVSGLVGELESHPESGLAAGLLLRADGTTIDTSGNTYTTWGLPASRNRDQATAAAPQQSGYIFGVSGGAFLARTDMFQHIGLFDEAFFMYYEDFDISFRAQLAGYKVRYSPDATAYHKLGVSSASIPGLVVYNTFKNLPLLLIKNVPFRLLFTVYPRFFILYSLIFGRAIVRGDGTAALRGFFKCLLLTPRAIHERHKIQTRRVVTPSYINSIILHDLPPEQRGMRRLRKVFTNKP